MGNTTGPLIPERCLEKGARDAGHHDKSTAACKQTSQNQSKTSTNIEKQLCDVIPQKDCFWFCLSVGSCLSASHLDAKVTGATHRFTKTSALSSTMPDPEGVQSVASTSPQLPTNQRECNQWPLPRHCCQPTRGSAIRGLYLATAMSQPEGVQSAASTSRQSHIVCPPPLNITADSWPSRQHSAHWVP